MGEAHPDDERLRAERKYGQIRSKMARPKPRSKIDRSTGTTELPALPLERKQKAETPMPPDDRLDDIAILN